MDVRVLNYFLTVAQEENITKAAEVLHTTQSNLSRQLADLEESVGKKLFERGSRKITLTEEGMFLRKRAQEIVELVSRTENDLSHFGESISGTVHVGAIETHSMRFVADAMLELKESQPNIEYDFFSGSVVEIADGLAGGLLDFGILVAPIDMARFDYIELPDRDRFGLLMRKDDPLARLPAVRPEDLKDHPVWVAHQQTESNVLSGWLGRDINTLNIASTFNLITTPAMMVEQGFGAAFTFDNLVMTGNNGLCFRPLEPPVEAALYLVWKKYQMFTAPAKAFLEKMRQKLSPSESYE